MSAETSPVALVTGASRGIGKATALLLARRGFRLAIHARHEANLAETIGELAAAGCTDPLVLGYDVADNAAIKAAFVKINARFGRLDASVHNAGIMEQQTLSMVTPEHVDRVLGVNVRAVIMHMHYATRLMARRRAGAIVNLSSIVALRGTTGLTAYSASKAAVSGATIAAAKELAPLGIRVNAVAPGFIETDMTRDLPPETRVQRIAGIPSGRMGTAEDVAKAIAFLVGEDSAYITAQVLGVDGGMVI